jgi:hypothetical protein
MQSDYTSIMIKNSASYGAAIREKLWGAGKTVETPFFELGLDDITRAADLFRPIYDRTNGWTGGSRWKYPRCWLTTRRVLSLRQRICTPERGDPIS